MESISTGNIEKYLPYGRQTITEEDINAVIEVLKGPYLTQGPALPQFEKSIATKVGANYGVAVNSATSALHIACLALGLGPGDELWTSPITFVASANCGRYCGANIDFVDIDPTTGLMDAELLEKKLKRAAQINRLPKIVVPVHLAGTSCNMEKICELSKEYKFDIIEDASHAIGGEYKGSKVGGCNYSAITVFSFHPVKIITTGEGGIAMTNDKILEERMRLIRSHGITKERDKFEQVSLGPWYYEQQTLGYNYRMSDLAAGLGLSQLARLDRIITERNKQYSKYTNELKDMPIDLLKIPDDTISSVHIGVILLKDADKEQHKQVFEGLRTAGIGVQLHYSPVHLQPYYKALGFKEGQFQNAEKYSNTALSLPLYPGLKEIEQIKVVKELKKQLKVAGIINK